MEISSNRQELEEKADFNMLGQAAIQQSAKLARGGMVQKAQVHAKAWGRHLNRGAQNMEQVQAISNYSDNVGEMYGMMNRQRKFETEERSSIQA